MCVRLSEGWRGGSADDSAALPVYTFHSTTRMQPYNRVCSSATLYPLVSSVFLWAPGCFRCLLIIPHAVFHACNP